MKTHGKAKKKNSISIPEGIYGKIEEIAAENHETPEEMLIHMLTAQITRALQSDCFYPGQKFYIDHENFIIARLFQTDLPRLQTWLQNKDRLELLTASKTELIILNQTKLNQTRKEEAQ